MTDTISDDARELTEEVWIIGNRLTSFDTKKTEIAAVIQSALTAARVKGREEAAKCVEDFDHPECEGGSRFADAIRAMKVQP